MQAILLAAGIGKRLGPAHDGPKCLLEFGGRTLLERHLDALATLGVDTVTLCLGHASTRIAQAIPARHMGRVVVHFNPLYTLGSIISLWTARQVLLAGDDVLIMDADVLYDEAILRRLVDSAHRDCFLLDRAFEAGDEPVKICLVGDRIVEFRKQLPDDLRYTAIGESVGFFKFGADGATRLARLVSAYCADARRALPHEEALRELALDPAVSVGIEDITGLAWIEIDFPHDIHRARQDILPRLGRL